MSKPNPRLSKGIVRTLAREAQQYQHPYPTSSLSSSASSQSQQQYLTLAPIVNHHVPSSSTSGAASTASSSKVVYGPHLPPGHNGSGVLSSGTTVPWLPIPSQLSLSALGSTSYLSLLPSWDTIVPSTIPPQSQSLSQSDSIVLPYAYRSAAAPTATATATVRATLPPSRSRHASAHSHARRYSTAASAPASSFLTPSLPPSFFTYDKPLSNQPSSTPNPTITPSQSSLDELLAALDLNSSSFFDKSSTRAESPSTATEPPFQHPPSPGPSSSPGGQHPMKPPRSAETHIVLAPTPLPPTNSASNSGGVTSYLSLAARNSSLSEITSPDTPTGNASTTSAYSSSLIFHLGASGLPKERLPAPPKSSAGKSRPPAPPRQRSFPLPDVTAPAQFRSVSVGEDAYFARFDGMCIADGVGGWARSGAGGADPGRWSRLLTHFCEVEVGDWWAGSEAYLADPARSKEGKISGSDRSDKTSHASEHEGRQKWAKDAWASGAGKDGLGSRGVAGTQGGQEEGRTRRPLDPVEIMQRGYEKCLACSTSEGLLGSSTCLLALLHNSTLHVANLGDCALLLIRDGEVAFRTSEMQHAFNFPLQVGTHSRDEPMKDAMRYDVPVRKGDIVVLGSDGLMDNLFDEDILDVVAQFTTPSESLMPNLPPTPPNSRPSSSSSSQAATHSKSFSSTSKPSSSSSSSASASTKSLPFPPFSPQRVSEALCRRARSVSELVTATTPFMCKAIEEGIDFVGGKKDDISVVVGVIGDRQADQPTQTDVRGPGALALHT